jgi:simple sugar transport system permease protein
MKALRAKYRSLQGVNTAVTFVAVVTIFAIFTPGHLFINPRNLASMAKLIPDLGMVALGVGILMIAGEFDLSVSSVLPFCSFIFALLVTNGMLPFPALLLTIPVGAVFGLMNGMIVVKSGLPSFIITLSTMMFLKGLLFGLSRLMPISLNRVLDPDMPFVRALTGTIGPIPVQFVWLLGIAVLLGIVLKKNKFGNWVYAVGSNQEAARAMGVNIGLVKVCLYVLIGVLCAFVSVMQATRLGSFAATQGVGFELKAIAAVVVGGTSLRGGVGSMWSIFLGLLIVRTLETGLILMRVPVFGVEAFLGIAVIIFVILNDILNRRSAT